MNKLKQRVKNIREKFEVDPFNPSAIMELADLCDDLLKLVEEAQIVIRNGKNFLDDAEEFNGFYRQSQDWFKLLNHIKAKP